VDIAPTVARILKFSMPGVQDACSRSAACDRVSRTRMREPMHRPLKHASLNTRHAELEDARDGKADVTFAVGSVS